MTEFKVRNYYRGNINLDEVKIEKDTIQAKDLDEAYDVYVTPEIENYTLLNWLINE